MARLPRIGSFSLGSQVKAASCEVERATAAQSGVLVCFAVYVPITPSPSSPPQVDRICGGKTGSPALGCRAQFRSSISQLAEPRAPVAADAH